MDWKYYFKISLFLGFFLCLVFVGTNVAARQLAVLTNEDIAPPFLLTAVADDAIRLDVLGDSYQCSVAPVQNSYSFLKSSIQNSWVTVKFNLAPRADYLREQLVTGIEQLSGDLNKVAKGVNERF